MFIREHPIKMDDVWKPPPYRKTWGWDLYQGMMMSIVGAEDPPVQGLLRCSGRDLPVEGGFC